MFVDLIGSGLALGWGMDFPSIDSRAADWQETLRGRFPILNEEEIGEEGKSRLCYLDSGASAQKPERVLRRLDVFYRHEYANIHRGVHRLSVEATLAWDGARRTVAGYLNAPNPDSCLFVRGATEGVNLWAQSVVRPLLEPGDTILVTEMEHHANLVPWHLIAAATGAQVRGVRVDPVSGTLDEEDFAAKLKEFRPKAVGFVHVSNVLGTVNPVKRLVGLVRELVAEALILVDGAQAVPHGPVDVQDLGCDAYVFSGHKLFGPTGIGVLWAKEELVAKARPYQGGGDMIERVSVEGSTYRGLPERFEAGTPHIAGALGLAAAIDEVMSWPLEAVHGHERELWELLRDGLVKRDGIGVLPAGAEAVGAVSFRVEGIHPHDLGTALDTRGVAIRVGHHCCQPLMKVFGVPATARASLAAYSNRADVEQFFAALDEVQAFFA